MGQKKRQERLGRKMEEKQEMLDQKLIVSVT